MNFEHLHKNNINSNILNKKLEILVFLYKEKLKKEENIKIKKEKLKLGYVTFEIKEIKIADYVITDTIEMVFSRQDNTITNELKLENRLAALN